MQQFVVVVASSNGITLFGHTSRFMETFFDGHPLKPTIKYETFFSTQFSFVFSIAINILRRVDQVTEWVRAGNV